MKVKLWQQLSIGSKVLRGNETLTNCTASNYSLISKYGILGKPKLNTIYCNSEKELKRQSFEDKWATYPWIYDAKTGKLYDYDDFLNEISPLNEWRLDDEIYTF